MTAVAVTGANGFVGSHVLDELTTRGFDVIGLVRSAQRVPNVSANPRFLEVDYEAERSVMRAIDGAQTVVHLVGHARQTAADVNVFERVNVGYTRRIVDAAAQAGVRRLVFLSSVKAIGNGSDVPYSEQTPARPADDYGRSKLGAENVVRALAMSSSIDHVIIRAPMVYGAGVKGNLRRLIAAIERGRPIPVAPKASNARSLISARNLASALGDTVAWEEPINETYLVSDGNDVSTIELVHMIARVAGKRARTVALPAWLLRGIASAVRQRPAADRFLESLLVDSSLFRSRFGWSPGQTLEEGLGESVAEYRSAAPGP